MDFMYKIEDRLLDELKEISQKLEQGEDMTTQCLDDVKDISISLSKLATYTAMKEGGYSNDSGMSNASRGGYSNGGYSNARGGQRRDSMGRFSNRGGYSRNGYGREEEWGREPYGMY